MTQADLLRDAADALQQEEARLPVLIGFDGFLDEIIHVVSERQDVDHYTRIDSLEEFGQRLSAASGLSCNIELVTQRIKLGGNGPILANALHRLGHDITYIGALGGESIHPVFDRFAEDCTELISLCDPAHTHALEFHDGKAMLGKMTGLREVNWEAILAARPREELTRLVHRQRLCGFVNWTMLPFMNSIFEGFRELFGETEERAEVFVDLADPAKRTPEDIREALDLLGQMQSEANVILGLNRNESEQIARLLGHELEALDERAAAIREALDLSIVVIHPTASAACATKDGAWEVTGPYTETPKLTTGAGDVFNSGFCHARISGLDPAGCLLAGVSASGYYVRQAKPGNEAELVDFMRRWAAVDCGEI